MLRPPPPLPPIPGVSDAVALFSFEGSARRLVTRWKYSNHRDGVPALANAVALTVPVPPEFVTWVPTTPGRRRARGFDQGEQLARGVGRRLERPTVALLQRDSSASQTGSDRAHRRGVEMSIRKRSPWLAGATVLLVDDVCTTGSSLTAAVRALHRGGAGAVIVRVLAATP
jgi:predicted amidophosphoribosyltransferase